MRLHKTKDVDPSHPVLYRHAKCKACDHRFTYHLSAAEDRRGYRPECPECGKQGVGGPFGRVNPAEWLPLVQHAAEGTPFTYADWLAGDAAFYRPSGEHGRGRDETWITVAPRREYLPCRITQHVQVPDVPSTGFSPEVWARWVSNGVEVTLVDAEEAPDPNWSPRSREST